MQLRCYKEKKLLIEHWTLYSVSRLQTSVFWLFFISTSSNSQIDTFTTLNLCHFELKVKKLRCYGVTLLQRKKTAYWTLNTAFCLPTSDFGLLTFFISTSSNPQIDTFTTLHLWVIKLWSYVVTMFQESFFSVFCLLNPDFLLKLKILTFAKILMKQIL